MRNILCLLFSLLAFSAEGQVIGIYGDLHGDDKISASVLSQMKKLGVTHVIGTGDFIGWGGPESLNKILSQITPLTGVQKENVYLFPGNWEHETNHPPALMNNIIAKYGQLVFENYDGYGFIQLGSDRIMVSHFPQHEVPDDFLPPVAYRRKMGNQAYVMETVERGILPPKDVAFEIFAHTHVGGLFREPQTGKIVVNPGVLDMRTKGPTEPRAFAVFDQKDRKLRFYNADTGKKIKSFRLEKSDASACKILLRDN